MTSAMKKKFLAEYLTIITFFQAETLSCLKIIFFFNEVFQCNNRILPPQEMYLYLLGSWIHFWQVVSVLITCLLEILLPVLVLFELNIIQCNLKSYYEFERNFKEHDQ